MRRINMVYFCKNSEIGAQGTVCHSRTGQYAAFFFHGGRTGQYAAFFFHGGKGQAMMCRPFLQDRSCKKSTSALLHRSALVKYISNEETIQDSLASLSLRMRSAHKGSLFRTCESFAAASVLHPRHLRCVGAFISAVFSHCEIPGVFFQLLYIRALLLESLLYICGLLYLL